MRVGVDVGGMGVFVAVGGTRVGVAVGTGVGVDVAAPVVGVGVGWSQSGSVNWSSVPLLCGCDGQRKPPPGPA